MDAESRAYVITNLSTAAPTYIRVDSVGRKVLRPEVASRNERNNVQLKEFTIEKSCPRIACDVVLLFFDTKCRRFLDQQQPGLLPCSTNKNKLSSFLNTTK